MWNTSFCFIFYIYTTWPLYKLHSFFILYPSVNNTVVAVGKWFRHLFNVYSTTPVSNPISTNIFTKSSLGTTWEGGFLSWRCAHWSPWRQFPWFHQRQIPGNRITALGGVTDFSTIMVGKDTALGLGGGEWRCKPAISARKSRDDSDVVSKVKRF